jgi:hypothetical protein
MVAHICNPSDSGDKRSRELELKASPGKSETLSQKTGWELMEWLKWESICLAVQSPEFKPQYQKKRTGWCNGVCLYAYNSSYGGGRGRRLTD